MERLSPQYDDNDGARERQLFYINSLVPSFFIASSSLRPTARPCRFHIQSDSFAAHRSGTRKTRENLQEIPISLYLQTRHK